MLGYVMDTSEDGHYVKKEHERALSPNYSFVSRLENCVDFYWYSHFWDQGFAKFKTFAVASRARNKNNDETTNEKLLTFFRHLNDAITQNDRRILF